MGSIEQVFYRVETGLSTGLVALGCRAADPNPADMHPSAVVIGKPPWMSATRGRNAIPLGPRSGLL
jgi:hypothetical protein